MLKSRKNTTFALDYHGELVVSRLCKLCVCKGTLFFSNMQTFAAFIRKIIDFFYEKAVSIIPGTEKMMSRELFRYAVCGGSNMVLDWVLYFVVYHFILRKEMLVLPSIVTISSHIAALCIVFPITLMTGFWLNKYVTFTQSSLRGWNQLERYILIVFVNLAVNYFGLKLLVDVCYLYPTPSKMLITAVTIAISYFGQKYFSFKK